MVGDLLGVVLADDALEFVDLPAEALAVFPQVVEVVLDLAHRLALLVARRRGLLQFGFQLRPLGFEVLEFVL